MKQLHSLLAWHALFFSLATVGCSQDRPKVEDNEELTIPENNFVLDVLNNSPTLSAAIALNASGHMLGFRETVDESGDIYSRTYFFHDGQQTLDLPELPGFTNTEIVALSDNGVAAGFASRAVGNPDGSLVALLWNTKSNTLTRLPPYPGDQICQAQDISADGRRVSGYTTGSEPSRLRPCVWTWSDAQESWNCQVLPTIKKFNPFLMSSGVLISPDGNLVAACITERFLDAGIIDSSLYCWQIQDGKWDPTKLTNDQLHLHDMNNEGVIVGRITQKNGQKAPCLVTADGELSLLDLLPNCVSGEATGINASGVVVGVNDDPPGPEGGPHAFVWQAGKTTPLALPKETLFSSAAAINDAGQIAGLADITFPPDTKDNSESAEQEPLVKTLAILWTPKAQAPSSANAQPDPKP